MRKSVMVGLSVLIVGGGMAIAHVHGAEPTPGRGRFGNGSFGRMIDGNIGRLRVLRSELSITQEQRARIREAIAPHRPAIAEVLRNVRDKRVALRDAIRSDKADETAVRTAAEELGGTLADAAIAAMKVRGDVAPALKEEQRSRIDSFLKENDAAIGRFLEVHAKTP